MKKNFFFIFFFLLCMFFVDATQNLILFGPPGSGKGTYAQKLCKEKNHIQISPGDLIRNEILAETPLGKQIRDIVAAGDYVDDNIVIEMMKHHLEEALDQKKYFILDGFPRSTQSLDFLLAFFQEHALFQSTEVREFTIDDDEAFERITQRRVCPQCSGVYNTLFHPPRDQVHCDECHIPVIQRLNDTPEVIRKRQAYYHTTIHPIYELTVQALGARQLHNSAQ